MKQRLVTAGTMFGLLLSMLVPLYAVQPAAHAETGFQVQDGRLYDANGNRFIPRGVSHPHAWFTDETDSFAGIASHGANAVRVVLSSGDRWTRNDVADVENVISLCKENQLICMLEVHDTTGYGEESGAITLDEAVDYWTSIQSALEGEEEHVLINIGNEPYGNDEATYSQWASDTSAAIDRMRNAGFDHTLVVDAPNWGQDWTYTMRDNAQSVYNSTPNGNVMFSIHMYGVFDTATKVQDYLNSFRDRGLPIMVGEFGHNHSDGDPAEDAIMATAERLGVGYFGWSWSGNSGGVEYLDMVNDFNANSLTSWGERIFNGPNGIQETAQTASVYTDGGGSDDTESPTAPGAPQATNTGSSTVTLSWGAASDNVGVTGYEVRFADGSTAATTSGTSTQVTGLSPETDYTFTVVARDAAGNTSQPSEPVAVTTGSGTPGPGECVVDYTVQNQWGSGFSGAIEVTNNGSAVDSWTLEFDFSGNQSITNGWKADFAQSGSTVTVSNKSWNGSVASGETVSIGFNATYSGSNPAPESFAFNGTSCTVS